MNRYEIYIKPDFNFIHWLNDESNNYKGYGFWKYFVIKQTKIDEPGVTINFIKLSEEGKPHITYHYQTKEFSFGAIWNFTNYDNLCAAWRYINIPAYFNSFNEAIDQILIFYNKKINYLCGQFLS